MIVKLLDIEKDLRECEAALRIGFRHINCIRDEQWFDLMEDLGFLVNGSFLPIIDIINKANEMDESVTDVALDSLACGLSDISKSIYKV